MAGDNPCCHDLRLALTAAEKAVEWANQRQQDAESSRDAWRADAEKAEAALTALQQEIGWLVLRKRETDPWEVVSFPSEADAVRGFDAMQAQWSDTFLCAVRHGPGHPLGQHPAIQEGVSLQATLTALQREQEENVPELLAALRTNEWAWNSGPPKHQYCPCCGRWKDDGHNSVCRVAIVLAKLGQPQLRAEHAEATVTQLRKALKKALMTFRQRPSDGVLCSYAAKPVNDLIDAIEATLRDSEGV